MMWKQFDLPSVLEVRRVEEEGRGLYAKCNLPLGKEVLRAEPYAYVLCNTERGKRCDCCLKPSDALLKCGRCKFVRYCSKTCQGRDWPLHKRECGGITRMHPEATPTDTMRLLIRTLHRRNTRKQSLPKDSNWEIDMLCSHKDDLSEEMKEFVAVQLFGIQIILGEGRATADFDATVAYDTMCRLLCNTFSIVSEELSSIGAGVYIGPSLLNHSCEPNCIVVFDGPCLHLRTIGEIPAGEQLLITYLELLDTKEQRQTQLQRVYHFQCSCCKCLNETCKESPYNMMYSTTDGSVSESKRIAAMKKGLQDLEVIEEREKKKDYVAVVELCQQSLERQAVTLHTMNVVTAKTQQLLRTAYIECQNWTKALEVADELKEPFRLYLPHYHPERAINFLMCGKLRRLHDRSEDLELSIQDLTQAIDLLKVAYGEHHPTTMETVELLQDSGRKLSDRHQK